MSKFYDIIAVLIVLSVLSFSSCVKKQIKKESQVAQDEKTAQQETIDIAESTATIMDVFEDTDTVEANIRDVNVEDYNQLLKMVHFDFDKYELSEEARNILKENAKIILENNFKILVEGHCDERGTNQYNLSLGQKRANVVKQYYINLGIPEDRIGTISYGEEKPLCSESNEECWAKNRRAETKVME